MRLMFSNNIDRSTVTKSESLKVICKKEKKIFDRAVTNTRFLKIGSSDVTLLL